jgi:hypothetical protein
MLQGGPFFEEQVDGTFLQCSKVDANPKKQTHEEKNRHRRRRFDGDCSGVCVLRSFIFDLPPG